ncbi:MAG: RNA polymerase sigma factor [Ignavibacteriaceae bacterium]|nr:RNA polymerase sigma factor [Ignavibacterium sp.]MCC6253950.1 RNA polymerase sigma factor [Ignavibacteriaceae bacterium]HRP93896.1 RNA polymerase sigma factor [Ignavibacteriaceae bacterium]
MHELNNDFELAKNFLNGDESAFNRLAVKYQEKIYWHARRMTGNHLDADEIVQEVLIVLHNKLNTFEFKSSLYTWIYTITNTRSINYLKKRKLKSFFSLDEISNKNFSNNDIIDNIESKQKLAMIEKALQKLPIKQREVFIMRNFDELSYEEISEITNKSVGTLKANYFHALNKIKDLVKYD